MTTLEMKYSIYQRAFNEYKEFSEEETTSAQRVFHARLTATLSLQKWLVHSPEDRQSKCYVAYLKLVDAWFTYEALTLLAIESGYARNATNKPSMLSPSVISTAEASSLANEFYAEVGDIMDTPKYKGIIKKYLGALTEYPGTSRSQTRSLQLLQQAVDSRDFPEGDYATVLAFSYAVRNAYAHGGETAYSGMKHYKLKAIILGVLSRYTFLLSASFGAALYESLTSEIS